MATITIEVYQEQQPDERQMFKDAASQYREEKNRDDWNKHGYDGDYEPYRVEVKLINKTMIHCDITDGDTHWVYKFDCTPY